MDNDFSQYKPEPTPEPIGVEPIPIATEEPIPEPTPIRGE